MRSSSRTGESCIFSARGCILRRKHECLVICERETDLKRRNSYSTFFCLALFLLFGRAFAFDHSHAQFDKVLKDVVVQTGKFSRVKYQDLKKNPKLLEEYLAALSAVQQSEFKGFQENERLAFLINAYNAFTLKLIIDNYPVKSIKEIGGIFSSPWKRKFFKLLGEDFHLDRIEHDIIRKDFDEPRIHFAVNCASIGCPPLAPFAFVAAKLDEQLEQVTLNFISDSSQNRWNAAKRSFEISSIFKWYGSDFNRKHTNHGAFLATKMGLPAETRKDALAGRVKYDYLDYDWSLNDAN